MTGESAPDPRAAVVAEALLDALTEYVGTEKTRSIVPEVTTAVLAALDATDPADDWDPAFCRTCGWLDCECPADPIVRPGHIGPHVDTYEGGGEWAG
jgi:hypothetical protein